MWPPEDLSWSFRYPKHPLHQNLHWPYGYCYGVNRCHFSYVVETLCVIQWWWVNISNAFPRVCTYIVSNDDQFHCKKWEPNFLHWASCFIEEKQVEPCTGWKSSLHNYCQSGLSCLLINHSYFIFFRLRWCLSMRGIMNIWSPTNKLLGCLCCVMNHLDDGSIVEISSRALREQRNSWRWHRLKRGIVFTA